MNISKPDHLIYLILTTFEDKDSACKMANKLLKEKIIPCVTFKDIESYFWWEGKINKSKEVQLMIKCKKQNVTKVCRILSENHTYEVPEIIYFPANSNENFHQWVNSFE